MTTVVQENAKKFKKQRTVTTAESKIMANSLQTVDLNEILSEKKFSYSLEKLFHLHLQIASLQEKKRGNLSYKNSFFLKTQLKEPICKKSKKSYVSENLNFDYKVTEKW